MVADFGTRRRRLEHGGGDWNMVEEIGTWLLEEIGTWWRRLEHGWRRLEHGGGLIDWNMVEDDWNMVEAIGTWWRQIGTWWRRLEHGGGDWNMVEEIGTWWNTTYNFLLWRKAQQTAIYLVVKIGHIADYRIIVFIHGVLW